MHKDMRIGALAALCVLGGCAAQGPAVPMPEPVRCSGAAECGAMWSRAQSYVAQRSHYKLQLVSESIIQTYSGRIEDVWLSYLITRETAADGSGVIRFKAGCGNFFGCSPRPTEAAADFYTYISQK